MLGHRPFSCPSLFSPCCPPIAFSLSPASLPPPCHAETAINASRFLVMNISQYALLIVSLSMAARLTCAEVFLFTSIFSMFLPSSSKSESSAELDSSSVDKTSFDDKILANKNEFNATTVHPLVAWYQLSNKTDLRAEGKHTHLFCRSNTRWHSSLYLCRCSAVDRRLPRANFVIPTRHHQMWVHKLYNTVKTFSTTFYYNTFDLPSCPDFAFSVDMVLTTSIISQRESFLICTREYW